ncbi:hypothetical protein ACLOJK_017342 [Asimina triloba]
MKLKAKQKKSDPAAKLVLEEIIGLTTENSSGLAANPSGECAYVAGCVVVVYNVESGTRKHMRMPSRKPKPLNCVSIFCGNGSCYVAAGESGHQPAVLIWDHSDQSLLAELKGHRYGVSCIDFSPDGKHLVSVGFLNDGYICLWDWRSGRLLSKLKESPSCVAISSVCFSSNGRFFMTAGRNHLKLWTLGLSAKSRAHGGGGLVIVDGKPTNLSNQKGSCFVAIAPAAWMPGRVGSNEVADSNPIYALTDAGILCVLHSGLSIRKWVDLKVERTFALSISNKFIACACNKGIVQLLMVEALKHIGNLLYSEPMERKSTEVSSFETTSSTKVTQAFVSLPDAIACQFLNADKLGCIAGGVDSAVSFATCSADGTIRLWDLSLQCDSEMKNSGSEIAVNRYFSSLNKRTTCLAFVKDPINGLHGHYNCPNICRTPGHSMKVEDQLNNHWRTMGESEEKNNLIPFPLKLEWAAIAELRKDGKLDVLEMGGDDGVNTGIFDQDARKPGVDAPGFRSMAVSSDGKYLAAGDYHGNLHVYNLHTSDYTCFQDAHDAEILSLSFSLPRKMDGPADQELHSHYLLASGGRDGMIHVYDVKRNFDLIESLDDHSAAVTSVKLTCNGHNLLSCSADRSVLFSEVAAADGAYNILLCHRHVASNGTVYDMAMDPSMEVVVTVGQDRKINIFDLATGKLARAFKQDREFGEPIKVIVDPSGSYLVFSYSDRSFSIHDFTTGDLVARAVGHSEVITGIIFLPDCKHIITMGEIRMANYVVLMLKQVGCDSCIFVWKMPALLSSRILQKITEHASYLCPMGLSVSIAPSEDILCEEVSTDSTDFEALTASENSGLYIEGVVTKGGVCEETSTFRFSISRLPKWAQTKVRSNESFIGVPTPISPQLLVGYLIFKEYFQQVQPEIPSPLAGCGEASATMTPVQNPCKLKLGNSQVYLADASETPFSMGALTWMDIGAPFILFALIYWILQKQEKGEEPDLGDFVDDI